MKKAPTPASSSFVVVADLRPASPTIILMTPVYVPVRTPGEGEPSDHVHDHRIAVLFDDDEDERVIDVLTAILYRAPATFSKIAAVHEHKGLMIAWAHGTTHVDRTTIADAAANSTVLRGDSWPVVVREMFWDPSSRNWKVREYSQPPQPGVPPPENADAHDLLIRALHEVVPLGVDPVQSPLDAEVACAIEGLFGQPSAPDNKNNETTLSLKQRGRENHE